jgi:hypothetical protein
MAGDTHMIRVYTHGEIIDTLCVWEAMLDVRALRHEPAYTDQLNELWDDAGVYEMRSIAIAISDRITGAWMDLEGTPADPCGELAYDFEFVPIMLAFIDWGEITPHCDDYNLPDAGTLKARFLLRFDRSTLDAQGPIIPV